MAKRPMITAETRPHRLAELFRCHSSLASLDHRGQQVLHRVMNARGERIGDAFGDVAGGAVDELQPDVADVGFKHAGMLASRVDVPLAARRLPTMIAERSVRMSPKRLLATTTSRIRGGARIPLRLG